MDLNVMFILLATVIVSVSSIPSKLKKGGRPCQRQPDCQSLYYCNMDSNRCEIVTKTKHILLKSGGKKTRCKRDSDCKSDRVCEQHECVHKKPLVLCNSDADCNAFLFCKEGACKDASHPGLSSTGTKRQKCTSKAQCNPTSLCKNGECTPKTIFELFNLNNEVTTHTPKQGCHQHKDCQTNYMCHDSKCKKGSIQLLLMTSLKPASCQVNSDCAVGKICKHGSCRMKKNNNQKRILRHKCIKATIGKTCQSSLECNTHCEIKNKKKLKCVKGVCQKTRKFLTSIVQMKDIKKSE